MADKPKTMDELQEELLITQRNCESLRRNYDAMSEKHTKVSMENTQLKMENTQLKMENDRLWRLVENLSQALNKE